MERKYPRLGQYYNLKDWRYEDGSYKIDDIISYFISLDEDLEEEKVRGYLPSREFVLSDFEQYVSIAKKSYRGYMPITRLLSVELAKYLARGTSLDDIRDEFYYQYYGGDLVVASKEKCLFTKKDFIDSLENKEIRAKKLLRE